MRQWGLRRRGVGRMPVQLRRRAVLVTHVPPILHVGGRRMAMRRWWQRRLLGAGSVGVWPNNLRQFDVVGFPLHH